MDSISIGTILRCTDFDIMEFDVLWVMDRQMEWLAIYWWNALNCSICDIVELYWLLQPCKENKKNMNKQSFFNHNKKFIFNLIFFFQVYKNTKIIIKKQIHTEGRKLQCFCLVHWLRGQAKAPRPSNLPWPETITLSTCWKRIHSFLFLNTVIFIGAFTTPSTWTCILWLLHGPLNTNGLIRNTPSGITTLGFPLFLHAFFHAISKAYYIYIYISMRMIFPCIYTLQIANI